MKNAPFPTMNYISILCGISRTSVANYFRGKHSHLSAETRERIRLTAEQMNYTPYMNTEWYEDVGHRILKSKGENDPDSLREHFSKGYIL